MKPVQFSPASQAVVDDYNNLPKSQKTAAYWSDDQLARVKKELKDHYIAEQKHRCAYCQQSIYSNNNAVWDAEHVISKQQNPDFMLEPRNLAISCKDCNIAKGEQEVRHTTKVSFPDKSSDYKIVHPHFDDYSLHIRWVGPICFARTNSKGSKTIAMCNLTRYAAIQLGATDNIMDERFGDLVWDMMQAKAEIDVDIAAAGMKTLLKSKK